MTQQPDRLTANTWQQFIEHVAHNTAQNGMGNDTYLVARSILQRGGWCSESDERIVHHNAQPLTMDRVEPSDVITACPLTNLTADSVDPQYQHGVAVDLLAESLQTAMNNVSPDDA
jgi:hypothetical protein